MRRALLAAALAVPLAVASPARADGVDAAATELFNTGRDLMKQGEYPAACPRLAESVRLEPTVGALAKLAECEEHERRLASAYARWQQALNLARVAGDGRVTDVEHELARVDAVVPKLRLVPDGPLPADAVLRVDEIALGQASAGIALPVEPGLHTVQVTAAGYRTWSTTVPTEANGATTTVAIPALAPLSTPTPTLVPAPALTPALAPAPSSPLPTLGLAVAATGVVTLAAGAVVGFVAMHQRNEAGCTGTLCLGDAAGDELRTAKSTADVSTALFVAGGVLAAGGVAAWWLSRDHASHGAAVVITPLGAVGRF